MTLLKLNTGNINDKILPAYLAIIVSSITLNKYFTSKFFKRGKTTRGFAYWQITVPEASIPSKVTNLVYFIKKNSTLKQKNCNTSLKANSTPIMNTGGGMSTITNPTNRMHVLNI